MRQDALLDTMLTIRQVADFLHVSISTVRRWSDTGVLRSYRIGPRGDRRYRREEVFRFLEESTKDSVGRRSENSQNSNVV
ncbi:MAG: helix-turn-helix domain-containing protein [Chloroflexi bacterium]|nr:helix-turn-helix domain-containing protein [Chloroflexota bacterium]